LAIPKIAALSFIISSVLLNMLSETKRSRLNPTQTRYDNSASDRQGT
jgi:hypothetical protein